MKEPKTRSPLDTLRIAAWFVAVLMFAAANVGVQQIAHYRLNGPTPAAATPATTDAHFFDHSTSR